MSGAPDCLLYLRPACGCTCKRDEMHVKNFNRVKRVAVQDLLLMGTVIYCYLLKSTACPVNPVILCGESRPVCHSCMNPAPPLNSRIINGTDVCPGQIPFQVSIRRLSEDWCGGVIIDERHVLTAAHCFEGGNLTQVVIGERDQSDPNDGQRYLNILEYELNERYIAEDRWSDNMSLNDIAIIRVAEEIEWMLTKKGCGSVNRICLPPKGTTYEEKAKFFVSGWGKTAFADQNEILQIAALKNLPTKLCYNDDRDAICAGAKYRDSSVGDSGGPLFRKLEDGRFELVGLVSFGTARFDIPYHGTYTKIVNYLDWINTTIAKEKLDGSHTLPMEDR